MLPVTRGLGQGTSTDLAQDTPTARALSHVLRSKGFTWCANSDVAAMYWSQAGSNFELSLLGSWWATLDRSQWPEEAVKSILQDFDDPGHDETQEVFTSVGDRRQEIVFIGPGLGDSASHTLIKSALDRCLLEDSELKEYIKLRSSRQDLVTRFETPFETNVKSY
jgi:G3E family GTPase